MQIHQALKVKRILSKHQSININTISKKDILSILSEIKFAETAFSRFYFPDIDKAVLEVKQALDLIKKLKLAYKQIILAESTTDGLFDTTAEASSEKDLATKKIQTFTTQSP